MNGHLTTSWPVSPDGVFIQSHLTLYSGPPIPNESTGTSDAENHMQQSSGTSRYGDFFGKNLREICDFLERLLVWLDRRQALR